MPAEHPQMKDLVAKALVDAAFRQALAADPAAAARQMGVALDDRQLQSLRQIAAQLNERLSVANIGRAVHFDPNAVAGHGSISW